MLFADAVSHPENRQAEEGGPEMTKNSRIVKTSVEKLLYRKHKGKQKRNTRNSIEGHRETYKALKTLKISQGIIKRNVEHHLNTIQKHGTTNGNETGNSYRKL